MFSGCVQAPEWGPDRVDWSLDLVSFIGVESWSDPLPRTNLPWEDPAGQEALSISGGHNLYFIVLHVFEIDIHIKLCGC